MEGDTGDGVARTVAGGHKSTGVACTCLLRQRNERFLTKTGTMSESFSLSQFGPGNGELTACESAKLSFGTFSREHVSFLHQHTSTHVRT